MSTTPIPTEVKFALVARAGGRCQFKNCNKPIAEDELTKRVSKTGVYAHIVADKPNGPRGDAVLSGQLADKIENLMLLCRDCHARIDAHKGQHYPVALLTQFKVEHEQRVARLLSIDGSLRSRVLRFTAPIGSRPVSIDLDAAFDAVLPRYPESHDHIDMTEWAARDHEPQYWSAIAAELVARIRKLVREPPNPNGHPWAIFALAPIPLLMLLGREVGDIAGTAIFQKHRFPDSWKWQSVADDGAKFVVECPSSSEPSDDVVLVLSVTGRVARPAIPSVLTDAPTWELSASAPGFDFVKTEAQRDDFGATIRQILEEICVKYGRRVRVHVMPAIPNSLAIEFGRRLLPKVDPSIRVYDNNRLHNGMHFALDLIEHPQGEW